MIGGRRQTCFDQGEKAHLVRLEDWFFDGMTTEEAAGLKSLIGKVWTVEAFHKESGTYELVFKHPRESVSPLEWVSVSPDWIARTS